MCQKKSTCSNILFFFSLTLAFLNLDAEVDALANEADMPLDELLKMYGYGGASGGGGGGGGEGGGGGAGKEVSKSKEEEEDEEEEESEEVEDKAKPVDEKTTEKEPAPKSPAKKDEDSKVTTAAAAAGTEKTESEGKPTKIEVSRMCVWLCHILWADAPSEKIVQSNNKNNNWT